MVQLSSGRPEDRAILEAFLQSWNTLRVARNGELVNSLDHPAILAWSGGDLRGAATYLIDGERCELLTLHTAGPREGLGTALLDAVQGIAAAAGCTRVKVVTTNDNLDALRFYQRRGFRLSVLRPGEVERSRRMLKPEIPETGAYSIPLRDEIELERRLG